MKKTYEELECELSDARTGIFHDNKKIAELERELAAAREAFSAECMQWMPLQDTHLAVRMDFLSEQQARKNHGQSLKMLKSRGGLSACEALAIHNGREWKRMREPLIELTNATATKEAEALRAELALIRQWVKTLEIYTGNGGWIMLHDNQIDDALRAARQPEQEQPR